MTRTLGCTACSLKLSELEQVYEKRLNSLADTFLTLVNNIQNNSLFKDLEKAQILQNRKKNQLQQLKYKISSFRMEFLQNVIEGVISQNQQNSIKKLEIENVNLRNENDYFRKLVEYNQLSYRNFQHQQMNQQEFFNQEYHCQSQYDDGDEQNYNQIQGNHYHKARQVFDKRSGKDYQKQIHKSKLVFKYSSSEIDCLSESVKACETPQSTSFVVNLKENGYQDLSNNCISSIDPVSEASSYPSSQKSSHKMMSTKVNIKPNLKKDNQVFTVSLREQLLSLNDNSKRVQQKPISDSKRRRENKIDIYDEQNQQNAQPAQYQFKYLKF